MKLFAFFSSASASSAQSLPQSGQRRASLQSDCLLSPSSLSSIAVQSLKSTTEVSSLQPSKLGVCLSRYCFTRTVTPQKLGAGCFRSRRLTKHTETEKQTELERQRDRMREVRESGGHSLMRSPHYIHVAWNCRTSNGAMREVAAAEAECQRLEILTLRQEKTEIPATTKSSFFSQQKKKLAKDKQHLHQMRRVKG